MNTIRYCPECGKAVSEKAKFCRYCGTRIPAVQAEKAFCPQCGRQCEPGERFCEDCGAELTPNTTPELGTTGFEPFGSFGADGIRSIQWDISSEQLEAQQENYDAQRMENFEYTRNPDGTYIVTRFKGMYEDSVTVPDCVKAIAEGAFEGARLIEVTLPEKLTFIGAGAFRNCRYLEEINIPSSVSVIEDEAFAGCEKLDITIPVTVKNQGKDILLGTRSGRLAKRKTSCIDQKEVSRKAQGEATHKIQREGQQRKQGQGYMRFEYDERGFVVLKDKSTNGHVYIPDDARGIANNAFTNCSKVISVTIPNSVVSIGNLAFSMCLNLKSISIPDSVTSIGDSAFEFCKCLTDITIPSSVTSISIKSIFAECSSLSNIIVAKGNQTYHSTTNCVIKTASKVLITGCKASVIPSDGSVTTIGDWAFAYCSNLTSIAIPNSVTTIGNRAFYSCTGLTSISIPHNTVSIGNEAFSRCLSLTSVTIPRSVSHIGDKVFDCCWNLTNIHYCGTKSQWQILNVNQPNPHAVIHCKDGTL